MGKRQNRRGKKLFSYLSLAVVVFMVVFLTLPQNYYVHKALINLLPRIDNYKIFENRKIAANDPQPWDYTDDADKKELPAEFQTDFDKYKTISFLVIQHNKVIFEKYWDNFGPESHTNSFSMAKSIVSLLVGAAIQDGFIQSVDQPVHDFIPEWSEYNGDSLRIKHLLTMSAGVDWDEAYSTLFSKTTQAYYGRDLWDLVLTEKQVETPGKIFRYQSGVTLMLGFILQKATGMNLSDYASRKLWTPIGAEEDAFWSLDSKDGMEKAYCCFNSNTRDFARLGQLVLNKGKWRGKQLVDSVFLTDMIKPANYLMFTPKAKDDVIPDAIPVNFYGYQMWIADYENMKIPYFRGILGQYIFVFPELDAVVVRLGHKRSKEYNVKQNHTLDVETWIRAGLKILKE